MRDGPRVFKERIRKRVAFTRHLTLSLTGEVSASIEVQVLHVKPSGEVTFTRSHVHTFAFQWKILGK